MVALSRYGAVAGAALALTGAGPTEGTRQVANDRFTTTAPGAPAGRTFAVDFARPGDPAAKPPAISRVELALHPGSRFDTAALPRCAATDPELVARGPAACPEGSRVGTGEITVDSGLPGDARLVGFDVTYFNADATLIILTRERRTGAHVPLRGRLAGNRLTIDVPPLPGTPPDGGANRRERATFPAAGRWLTTPATCPASGEWTNRVTYTYRDGVVQTAESTSPCRADGPGERRSGGSDAQRRSERRSLLGVVRPPARARTLNRRRGLHVAVRVDGTLTGVRARLVDASGRTIASAARRRLTRDTHLPLALRRRARPGRHRVVVAGRADGRILRASRRVVLR